VARPARDEAPVARAQEQPRSREAEGCVEEDGVPRPVAVEVGERDLVGEGAQLAVGK